MVYHEYLTASKFIRFSVQRDVANRNEGNKTIWSIKATRLLASVASGASPVPSHRITPDCAVPSTARQSACPALCRAVGGDDHRRHTATPTAHRSSCVALRLLRRWST